MKVRRFNPTASHSARAVQAWQILIGKAMCRQTVTYLGLSQLMYGRNAQGVLAAILGRVAFFCADHGLPPLTAIVVNKRKGRPGHAIPIASTQDIDEERERVYSFGRWFDIYPPSETELDGAFHDR